MTKADHEVKGTEATPSTTIVDLSDSIDAKDARKSDLEKLRNKLRPVMLYLVSMAQFLDVVNGSSVSVAILPIAEDLQFTVTLMPWIISAYTIAFAGLLLFSGRMGDLFGHRRMLMFGLSWFATWALVISFSTSPVMFIVARCLQGVGAACTVPTATALIATNYPPGPERTKAFSVFASFGGLGAVVGILLAGGLVATIGWRWIFRVSSITAFVLFSAAFFVIPVVPKKEAAERPRVDYLGAAASTLGVTGIIYYITMGPENGWSSPKTLPVLFAGLLLLVAFVYIESKIAYPIMPFRIWKSPRFSASVVTAFIQMGMSQGTVYYLNLVFQEVYEWTVLKTAVGFLVHALVAIVAFTILGRIIPRLYLKPLIIVGFLLRCGSSLMFAFLNQYTNYWRIPFPALILHAVGLSFCTLPIQLTAIRDAPNKDQGLVGAIYNTALQLGAPFGLAIVNVVSVSINGQEGGSSAGAQIRGGPQLMKGYKYALIGTVVIGVIGIIVSATIMPWDKPLRPSKPATKDPEALQEINHAADEKEEKLVEREEEMAGVEALALALDTGLAGIGLELSEDGEPGDAGDIGADDSTVASGSETSKS